MSVEITNAYVRGYKKLPKHIQEEVLTAILELARWPNLPPGRNLEKLHDDPGGTVYSIRLDLHFRMLVQPMKDGFRLRDVGTHDELYAREARNR
jgi:mRNA-degrading endonuclease RelE of RelBE toxin-antitoxin system